MPSRLAWRVCMATTSGSGTCSSKTSSTVTTRSRAGIEAHRAFKSVVLPAWVPPATRMFRPAATAPSRNRAACSVNVPSATISSNDATLRMNLRMLTAMWARVICGITTCSRDPSGNMASTNGVLKSMRRPDVRSIRSTRSATWSAVRITVVSSERPRRAMNTRPGSLIQISSTVGSSSSGCNGPNPATRSSTARAASFGSPSGGNDDVTARFWYSVTTSSSSRPNATVSSAGSRSRRRTSSRTSSSTICNAVATLAPRRPQPPETGSASLQAPTYTS